MDKFKNLRGQTLVELLVTIVIIAGLASMLILYTRTGMLVQNLSRTAEKAVFDIRRAQHYALALREFHGMTPCAYGVRFVRGERHYTIFADIADDCTRADGIMQPHEIVEVIQLEERIVVNSTNIHHVTFRSPTADTVLLDVNNRRLDSHEIASIIFAIDRLGATLTRTVTINRWGRVQVEPPPPPRPRPPFPVPPDPRDPIMPGPPVRDPRVPIIPGPPIREPGIPAPPPGGDPPGQPPPPPPREPGMPPPPPREPGIPAPPPGGDPPGQLPPREPGVPPPPPRGGS